VLRVNEIFDSIQGEGINVGRLTTFVRLQGCNLNCKWCDTGPAKALDGGYPMSEEAILSEIFHPLVTLTGGEPMVQSIAKLVEMCKLKKWEVHVETNGTIMPAPHLTALVDFWSVSPKRQAAEGAFKTVRFLVQAGVRGQIKFVVDSMDGIKNYQALKWAHAFMSELGRERLPAVLQPCWMDPAITYMDRTKYEKRYKQIAYYVKQHWPSWDVRLIPQMHKMLALDRNCHKTIGRKDPDSQWKGA
jgi:organic radical activating enzyme